MTIFPTIAKAAMGPKPYRNSGYRGSSNPHFGIRMIWTSDRLGGALVAFGASGHISLSQ